MSSSTATTPSHVLIVRRQLNGRVDAASVRDPRVPCEDFDVESRHTQWHCLDTSDYESPYTEGISALISCKDAVLTVAYFGGGDAVDIPIPGYGYFIFSEGTLRAYDELNLLSALGLPDHIIVTVNEIPPLAKRLHLLNTTSDAVRIKEAHPGSGRIELIVRTTDAEYEAFGNIVSNVFRTRIPGVGRLAHEYGRLYWDRAYAKSWIAEALANSAPTALPLKGPESDAPWPKIGDNPQGFAAGMYMLIDDEPFCLYREEDSGNKWSWLRLLIGRWGVEILEDFFDAHHHETLRVLREGVTAVAQRVVSELGLQRIRCKESVPYYRATTRGNTLVKGSKLLSLGDDIRVALLHFQRSEGSPNFLDELAAVAPPCDATFIPWQSKLGTLVQTNGHMVERAHREDNLLALVEQCTQLRPASFYSAESLPDGDTPAEVPTEFFGFLEAPFAEIYADRYRSDLAHARHPSTGRAYVLAGFRADDTTFFLRACEIGSELGRETQPVSDARELPFTVLGVYEEGALIRIL